ncbi:MAG: hypothetical protein IT285_11680 [Bdellovibrionales bacterium]|nr:hypothetical protein [Bdellovibrionales bacterium]
MFTSRTERARVSPGSHCGVVVALVLALAAAAPCARAGENPVFAYPHMLPSPYTLPAGTLIYGSTFAAGLTDFLTVSTNAWLDFNEVFNASAKISLVDYPAFAFSLTGSAYFYNLNSIDPRNPDVSVTSWQPGAVAAFGLGERLALFTGASMEITDATGLADVPARSGFVSGAKLGVDLAFMYGNAERGAGNALAAGVSYDATYSLIGLGLCHHWPGFQLGVHVYPGAEQNRVLPILAGGGSASF